MFVTLFIMLGVLGTSWLLTYGVVWLICVLLNLTVTVWKIATATWLALMLIKAFTSNFNKSK